MSASVRATITAEVIGSDPWSGVFKRAHALGVTDAYPYQRSIPDAATNTSLLVNLTTITALFLYSDQAVTIKLNGAATGVLLAAKGFMALMDVTITAVTVSNASGSTANVFVLSSGA